MNATASPAVSQLGSIGARLRNFAIGSLFALVLLVSRPLRLRHNAQAWLAFRITLALVGAAMVVVPMSIAASWIAGTVGLALFVASILLPPAKADDRVAGKAKELGALVVLNGGQYQPGEQSPAHAQLFVTSDRIYALDARLQLLLVIPLAEISSATAVETHGRWILRIRWLDRAADFHYHGVFAEHLARVAESTVRSLKGSPLVVLRQSRAAGA
jgi:hypothetical protein